MSTFSRSPLFRHRIRFWGETLLCVPVWPSKWPQYLWGLSALVLCGWGTLNRRNMYLCFGHIGSIFLYWRCNFFVYYILVVLQHLPWSKEHICEGGGLAVRNFGIFLAGSFQWARPKSFFLFWGEHNQSSTSEQQISSELRHDQQGFPTRFY